MALTYFWYKSPYGDDSDIELLYYTSKLDTIWAQLAAIHAPCSLTAAWWHMHMSVNSFIIGPANGLAPVRCQAITRSSADLLFCWNKLYRNLNQNTQTFLSGKCFWKSRLQNVGHFVRGSMCYLDGWLNIPVPVGRALRKHNAICLATLAPIIQWAKLYGTQ